MMEKCKFYNKSNSQDLSRPIQYLDTVRKRVTYINFQLASNFITEKYRLINECNRTDNLEMDQLQQSHALWNILAIDRLCMYRYSFEIRASLKFLLPSDSVAVTSYASDDTGINRPIMLPVSRKSSIYNYKHTSFCYALFY